MESPWSENLSADRERAIEELVRGQEFTKQLRTLLDKPKGDDHKAFSAGDLITRILRSFNESISILTYSQSDEVSQIPADKDGQKSEDSGESRKSSGLKDRRGCYKRRRTTETWTKVTDTLVDDGHAWRKYGQKVILNATHPRNYYRCTHKTDQGCQATKQVQRTDEDDKPTYRTTYYGHHTCRTLLKAPQIILGAAAPNFANHSPSSSASIILNFGSNDRHNNHHRHSFITPEVIKQEDSSSDYLFSPDLRPFGSEHGDLDVISGAHSSAESSRSFEMDLMTCSVDFDDLIFDF